MSKYWFARSPVPSRLEWIAHKNTDWRRARIGVVFGPRIGLVPVPVSPVGHLVLWLAIAGMIAGGLAMIIFGREAPQEAGLLLLVWLVAIGVPTAMVMNRRCDPDRPLEDYASEQKSKQTRTDTSQ